MNQKMYEVKVLLNKVAQTTAVDGSAVDLAPSASVGRREMKVMLGYQVLTAGTFPVSVAECDTTDGTYSAVAGDTIANVVATQAAQGFAEYHLRPTKRYLKASVGTVAGTNATANLLLLIQNLKREA